MGLGLLRGLLAGVAPVHVRQLHRLARGRLHGLRERLHLRADLLVRRADPQGEQRCPKVSTAACSFDPFLRFAPS